MHYFPPYYNYHKSIIPLYKLMSLPVLLPLATSTYPPHATSILHLPLATSTYPPHATSILHLPLHRYQNLPSLYYQYSTHAVHACILHQHIKGCADKVQACMHACTIHALNL